MSDVARHITDLPPEQEAIRAKCFHPSGSFVEFKKEEIEQSIPDRFERQVARYPDRIAVKTRGHTFTYDELNRAANRVAHAILDQSELRRPDQTHSD
jgi:non-ribosomal peptide synthetase component F